MNYYPTCGFCLKDSRTEREKDPFSTYYKAPFPQQQGILGNGINFPPNYYVTSKGAINGTKTSTKG